MIIAGTGFFVPEKILTNLELNKKLELEENWIYSRTGIKERRIVSIEEKTSDLAIKAAKEALKKSEILPEEIDLIICCTITPDKLCPSTACKIQNEIGAKNATSFDLNSACSGFIFGLCTAYQYIQSGFYSNILVVGADILSKYTNYKDKTTCILFGDGAGAFLLKKSNSNMFLDFYLKTFAEFSDVIKIPATGTEVSNLPPFLTLDGKEVFKWAVNSVSNIILDMLEKNNLKTEDIDYFLLHQANQRINNAIATKLGLNKNKFLSNIESYGNTSAASIPILFSENINNGTIKKGQKLLLAGFGAGLSIGASIINF
ncbi:MAG: beta-ketoacyl-ACP synthase III [Candidatus Sericytochromatia bacterium]